MREQPYRWGIIATGNIAAHLAKALSQAEGAELLAVASRRRESADEFADAWDIPRRYGSYADLIQDPDVDIVYVATPHPFHHENVIGALHAGKHVLCEKPLTLNAAQAAECATLAGEHGLFLMEAIWMRFMPAIARLRDVVADGVIGKVGEIRADFCIDVPFDPDHRLYSPKLGGGALLDLAIYPISLSTMLLGQPDAVSGQAEIGRTGVDESNQLTLSFADGAQAHLTSSVRQHKPRTARIIGSKGWIDVPDFVRSESLVIHAAGTERRLEIPARGIGYVHEIDEVHRCLGAGLIESPVLTLDETVATLQAMDELRRSWGVVYPGE